MINALNSILTIFVMIGIGSHFTRKKWFDEKTKILFAKIVVNISLPALSILKINTRFSKEMLTFSIGSIGIAFGVILLLYLISIAIAKSLNMTSERSAVFSVAFTFSNTVFIGFPVNIALFGETGLVYALLYYFANTILFWTLGIYRLSSCKSRSKYKKIQFENIEKIFSPPLVSLVIGYIMVMLDIPLPDILIDTFEYIGNLTVPLAMMFIGITIYSMDYKSFKMDLSIIFLILGRLLISPLIMYLCLKQISLPIELKKVFVVEAGMPVMAQMSIVAKYYDADSDFAAIMVSITTLLLIFTIPIYAWIFTG